MNCLSSLVLLLAILIAAFVLLPPVAAESASKGDQAWGVPVNGVQISLLPKKPVYDEFDPITFAISVRNIGTTEALLKMALFESIRGTSCPQSFSANILESESTSGPTWTWYPKSLIGLTTESMYSLAVHDRNNPAFVHLPPGGASYFQQFDLDSGFGGLGQPLSRFTSDYTCTVIAHIDTGSIEFKNVPFDALQHGRIGSNECAFALRRNDNISSRTYHAALNGWWEKMDLSLSNDGRFIFGCFSDAGGYRPIVKGHYDETTDTIILHGEVNEDVMEFKGHTVWEKVEEHGVELLAPPSVLDKYLSNLAKIYPVLSPVGSAN